jgi:hypothetical protein
MILSKRKRIEIEEMEEIRAKKEIGRQSIIACESARLYYYTIKPIPCNKV